MHFTRCLMAALRGDVSQSFATTKRTEVIGAFVDMQSVMGVPRSRDYRQWLFLMQFVSAHLKTLQLIHGNASLGKIIQGRDARWGKKVYLSPLRVYYPMYARTHVL